MERERLVAAIRAALAAGVVPPEPVEPRGEISFHTGIYLIRSHASGACISVSRGMVKEILRHLEGAT